MSAAEGFYHPFCFRQCVTRLLVPVPRHFDAVEPLLDLVVEVRNLLSRLASFTLAFARPSLSTLSRAASCARASSHLLRPTAVLLVCCLVDRSQ